ncbi:hypothetical protein MMC22_009423 [Lobaria immixta]|nr:hypothetical protein [Lobaria immixta]
MLYIDQLNQVTFSYDAPSNGTLDLVTENITLVDFCRLLLRNSNAEQYILPWDFSIQKLLPTANDTANAARALWHFAHKDECPISYPEIVSLPTRNFAQSILTVKSLLSQDAKTRENLSAFLEPQQPGVSYLKKCSLPTDCNSAKSVFTFVKM